MRAPSTERNTDRNPFLNLPNHPRRIVDTRRGSWTAFMDGFRAEVDWLLPAFEGVEFRDAAPVTAHPESTQLMSNSMRVHGTHYAVCHLTSVEMLKVADAADVSADAYGAVVFSATSTCIARLHSHNVGDATVWESFPASQKLDAGTGCTVWAPGCIRRYKQTMGGLHHFKQQQMVGKRSHTSFWFYSLGCEELPEAHLTVADASATISPMSKRGQIEAISENTVGCGQLPTMSDKKQEGASPPTPPPTSTVGRYQS
ncbi:hypothetical protein DFH06DRAFT_1136509 [Mycena polygramma]|nr:hypothetical protein DFH06DRAFT_1136509 [Mycena polygramma]